MNPGFFSCNFPPDILLSCFKRILYFYTAKEWSF